MIPESTTRKSKEESEPPVPKSPEQLREELDAAHHRAICDLRRSSRAAIESGTYASFAVACMTMAVLAVGTEHLRMLTAAEQIQIAAHLVRMTAFMLEVPLSQDLKALLDPISTEPPQ